jgi:hypothetical protein
VRENSLLYSSNLPLGVPKWTVIYTITHRHSKDFSGAVVGEAEDFCKGSFACTSFTFFKFCFTLFLLASFYQKQNKISILYSCFYLSAFSFARMATPENTKLCDFTSTNNSDFICTPIVPPAPATNFYEIKSAL